MPDMTIEAVLLAKNRGALDRLLLMMRSLVVKEQNLADRYETMDTVSGYESYEAAYEACDTVFDYNISTNDFLINGFTAYEAVNLMAHKDKLQSMLMARDSRTVMLMKSKRAERVRNYTEVNPYYQPFMGYPSDPSEYIPVYNDDEPGKLLYLHEVSITYHPKTYNRLFVEREVLLIYQDFNYLYLKFLEDPLTPYYIRNKKQFEICYYAENVLEKSEEEVFFECYNIAREEIYAFDYIEAFEATYDTYTNVMYMLVLFYTFSLYSARSLQRYAIRNYTEDEIYDIIDSANLGNLKRLPIALLRRVVQHLPDLQSTIGTKSAIDVIFDIVADASLNIKEYQLEKRYSLNNEGETSFNQGATYDKSVDLVFKEHTIKKGSEAILSSEQEFSYDTIVEGDPTWGGVGNIADADIRKAIRDDMKRTILSKDFASLSTKYISLSKIIDMYAKTLDLSNKLGLLYQLNELSNNFMKDDKVIFKGIELPATTLYAAWCYSFAILNGVSNADYIPHEAGSVEGIIKLRTSGRITADALELSHVEIDMGNGYKRELGYYLTEEEIKKYLVGFTYTPSSRVDDVLSQYEANFKIIQAIEAKLNAQHDLTEYNVWNTIRNANLVSRRIGIVFEGYEIYSGFIKNKSAELWEAIEPILTDRSVGWKVRLKELFVEFQEGFSGYLSHISSGVVEIATDESAIAGGENIADIALLFNEFISYYTQLYKQDFHAGYNDPGSNSMTLLYTTVQEFFKSFYSDTVELTEEIIKDHRGLYNNLMGELMLSDFITDKSIMAATEEIFLDLEQINDILRNIFFEFLTLDIDVIHRFSGYTESVTLALDDTMTVHTYYEGE